MCGYSNYNILKDFIDNYPSDALIEKLTYPKYKNKNKKKTDQNEYNLEKIDESNIVFYIKLNPIRKEEYNISEEFKKTDEYKEFLKEKQATSNQYKIRLIIQKLMELFPDSLNIGSGFYPRFNFKINNSIFISFGDGTNKEEKIDDPRFIRPSDYNVTTCLINKNEIDCNKVNEKTLFYSNHELCKYNHEKKICGLNNIKSYNKLLLNTKEKKLFLKDENDKTSFLKTSNDVYEYLGL